MSQANTQSTANQSTPVVSNDTQHIHVEDIRNTDTQAIENVGGRRNREDDQTEERQVRPRLEAPVADPVIELLAQQASEPVAEPVVEPQVEQHAEQHVDQFVEFNDDWIPESDSEFESDPESGEDGFDGWLQTMDYYDPNGEEYDPDYGY